jgi:WD40 repeat protein
VSHKDLEVDETGVRTVAFSQDQNFLVSGGNDSVLRVWSVESGKCLREFQGHSKEITAAEFSSNGRLVISSSVDGTVMIWEVDWDWEFKDKKPVQAPWEEK